MSRNRLTDQAIANVKAAENAELEKGFFGYQVHLRKGPTSVTLVDKTNRPVVYTSKDAAKRALGRHNCDLRISLKPQI
jgi:hypothetical protein